ncbi:MAG TPA: hydroxypyruvate isomerase family protein [Geminicoccaceae bacterium]|nr:hydroxypyruvate isomerase family protein [Geminicoccus sp.]HMU52084.1 hydroxypyruvate isomerase family protein [Geminicoccaceae bacterium]
MPKFAANLSMMFQEVPFLDRFAAARAAGFAGVEFLFPYDFPKEEVAARLNAAGLSQALFNTVPGDFAKGERGLAALPGREAEFQAGVDKALDYAAALGCPTIHCMAGLRPADVPDETLEATYVANLTAAAAKAAGQGIVVVIEPINTRDIPGYFLNYQRQGRKIVERIGAANLKLQLDLYHCQIMEGDLAMHIRDYADITGHVQIAGVPERHEPDVGEVNYPYLYELLDRTGYAGWVGCEYRPRGRTEDGLGWFAPWRG